MSAVYLRRHRNLLTLWRVEAWGLVPYQPICVALKDMSATSYMAAAMAPKVKVRHTLWHIDTSHSLVVHVA